LVCQIFFDLHPFLPDGKVAPRALIRHHHTSFLVLPCVHNRKKAKESKGLVRLSHSHSRQSASRNLDGRWKGHSLTHSALFLFLFADDDRFDDDLADDNEGSLATRNTQTTDNTNMVSSTYGSLAPSAHSTEHPSGMNLEAGERAKLLGNGATSTTNGKPAALWSPLTKGLLLALVAAAGTVLATQLYYGPHAAGGAFTEPADNHLDATFRHGPLSRLDPVMELGLYDYARSAATQPSFQQSALAQQATAGAALPTNSWYQSFLLLPRDVHTNPSTLHRAYSMPYVVDAAGPVAGVRIYPTQAVGSSTVVQLAVLENQGVTTGLAPAKTTSKKTSTVVSRRYEVEEMTSLGVTLSWVRTHRSFGCSCLFSLFASSFLNFSLFWTDGIASANDRGQGHALRDAHLRESPHCVAQTR
jgi:hypothetical protein